MQNWFADTFSSDAKEEDLVKSRSLNITRITGVVVPVLAGVSVALGEFADKPPFNDAGFQRHVVLALLALIALVATADILGRSIASRASQTSVGTILPKPLPATLVRPGKASLEGRIVAFRNANGSSLSQLGEYLFVPKDSPGAASWELFGAFQDEP